jgi:protein-arginine kinase activator protein McsA
MSKCIMCEKPLPTRSASPKSKKATDLLCESCKKTVQPSKKEADEADADEPDTPKMLKERLKYLNKMSKELEDMILTHPDLVGQTEDDLAELPESIQAYAFTPVKSYKMVQFLLAITKGEYMDSIVKQDSEARLKKALETSIKEEDYLKSAKLRDKIKETVEKTDKRDKKSKSDKK